MADFYAHVQRPGEDVERFLATALPSGIKLMGSTSPAAARAIRCIYEEAGRPRPFIWRREWWDDVQSDWIREGTRGARRWFERFCGALESWMTEADVHTFELQNEFIANDLEDTRRETEWTVEAVRLLTSIGAIPVAGNHSVGWPKMESFAEYKPAIWAVQQAGGYWANHEYAWPGPESHTGQDLRYFRWYVARHRDILTAIDEMGLHVDYLITEFGWDSWLLGVGERHGFRWLDVSDQSKLLSWIKWYLENLHPTVKGAAFFQTGAQDDWREFDLVGSPVEADAAAIIREMGQRSADVVRVWRRALGRVDAIPLEAYVAGVVPCEVYTSWPMEALKAQAVWARSHARYRMDHPKHGEHGADVCDGPCCQVYGESRDARTDEATAATAGQVWRDADVHMYEYVNECGRDDCPHCRGEPGHLGKVWPTRACQWGAKALAEAGKCWQEITAVYYGGGPQPTAVTLPHEEPARDGATVRAKARWWVEEAVRRLESAGADTASPPMRVLYSLIDRERGLMYRPEYERSA